jgi:hypothetical protein
MNCDEVALKNPKAIELFIPPYPLREEDQNVK